VVSILKTWLIYGTGNLPRKYKVINSKILSCQALILFSSILSGCNSATIDLAMKDSMNTIIIILLICGIAYLALFHRSKQETVPELKHWFSNQLISISKNLEKDIELDKQGHYAHPGRQSFEPRGSITYTLLDKNLSRFELSQFNELTSGDIESTQGYQHLRDKVESLGLSIRLDEIEVEGDGVETWNELDEYVDDIPRFYTITISGWSA